MAAIDYSKESWNTIDARRIRNELAERNANLTIEEVWEKEDEARRRMEARGFVIPTRDPRTEPRNG